MKRINLVLQEILRFLLIFLLVFVWARFIFRKLWLALLISFLVSAVFYLFLIYLFRKRKHKGGLKLKEKEDAENMFFSLVVDDKRMDFFEKLALSKHKNVKKYSKYLIISHENGTKTLLYVLADFENLTISHFVNEFNKVKGKAQKYVFFTYAFDENVPSFAHNFDGCFLFLNRFSAYENLFKYYQIFPPITQKYKKDKALTFKDFLAYSLSRKRAKGYMLSAFLLALSALFVRTTIYYVIVASVLILLAIFSQFNPIFNIKEEKEIL